MSTLQNLFVAKLPRNLTDGDLQQIFSAYNPSSAKIMLDATTGKSKGFGFVLFDSEEKGEKAYKALNKTHVTLHGHSFNLAIFPSKHDGKVATEVSNCLFIRNIPKELSQMEVENFLKTFGNLTYCAMREDHYGSPVWVVYAEYEKVEEAKAALTKLHGNKSYFEYYPAAVLAKYADSEEAKKERRKRREGQHSTVHSSQVGGGNLSSNNSGSVGGSAHPFAENGARVPPPPPPPPPKHRSHHIHGYNGHFYDSTNNINTTTNNSLGLPAYGGPAVAVSAGELYTAVNSNANAEPTGTSPPPPPPPPPPQQQPGSNSFAADVAPGAPVRNLPTYTSAPSHRFAPPTRGLPLNSSGSVDSAMVSAFGAHAGTATMLPSQHQQQQAADAQMNPPGPTGDGGGNDTHIFGGSAGCGLGVPQASSTLQTTPLSSSFLNVTFPTCNPHFDPSSNGHGTPVTPLSFNFDAETDSAVQSGLLTGGDSAHGNSSFHERSPVRAISNLSARSITSVNGTRYRHNPYAPVTPISSVPSSSGPSTPRVHNGSPHTPGCAVGYSPTGPVYQYPPPPPQQQMQMQMQPLPLSSQTPQFPAPHVGMNMHFGYSHTNSGGGGTAMTASSHFASSGANGYLAVAGAQSRDAQQQQQQQQQQQSPNTSPIPPVES